MSKAQGIALRRPARTESRKDRGSVNIGNIGATEDAARRWFAAVATPTFSHVQPPAATRLAGDINRPSRNESPHAGQEDREREHQAGTDAGHRRRAAVHR